MGDCHLPKQSFGSSQLLSLEVVSSDLTEHLSAPAMPSETLKSWRFCRRHRDHQRRPVHEKPPLCFLSHFRRGRQCLWHLLALFLRSFFIASPKHKASLIPSACLSCLLHSLTISTMTGDQGGWNDIAVSDLLLSADYILHGN